MNNYPDMIRCVESSTIGPMTKPCNVEKVDKGFVYATIEGKSYMIPICRIEFIIRNAKGQGIRKKLGKIKDEKGIW